MAWDLRRRAQHSISIFRDRRLRPFRRTFDGEHCPCHRILHWRGQWVVSGNDTNGVVVQEVDTTQTTTHSDGQKPDVYTSRKWEGWEVLAGHERPIQKNNENYDDDFGLIDIKPHQEGDAISTTLTGSARYYPNMDGLPKNFYTHAATRSGSLRSTTEDPHLPTEGASPPVKRSDTYVNRWGGN